MSLKSRVQMLEQSLKILEDGRQNMSEQHYIRKQNKLSLKYIADELTQ